MDLSFIQSKIHIIRGVKVMLDFDLAEIYETETRRLKEQVRRNIERFPPDFMFQLTKSEWSKLIAICDKLPETIKHSPITPFAFTQEGVAMLSGVLRSDVAIKANIDIMRAFVVLRQYALGYAELNQKLETFMIETNMQFFTFTGTRINRTIQMLLNIAGIKNTLDESSSSFFIDASSKDTLFKLDALCRPLKNIDTHISNLLKTNPAIMDFSKWGAFLPDKYKAKLVSDKYFDIEQTERFCNNTLAVYVNSDKAYDIANKQ